MRRVFPMGFRGSLIFGYLLGLTKMMAEVNAYSPNDFSPQFQPADRWSPKFETSGLIVGRHHNEEHPEDVGLKSFGRSFYDSKKRLDEIEDKIARRSFVLYGSRRSFAEEPLRFQKEYTAVRNALASQREGFDSHLNFRPGYSRILGEKCSDQHRKNRKSLSSKNRQDCAMKVLDLDGDVCGFVAQLVQLGKLLKKRNLLLRYMAEKKINTEGAAPQALTLFMSGIIRDVITSNIKMKSLLDKNKETPERSRPWKKSQNSLNGRQRIDQRRSLNNTTTVKEITETSTSENSTKETTLTNEPANRLYDNDFSDSSRNKINETLSANEKTIKIHHSGTTEFSTVSEISQPINSTDSTTSSANVK